MHLQTQKLSWAYMFSHAGMALDEGFADAAAVDTNPQPAESGLAVCSDQDLLKDIFHRLDIRDLCSASCVCKLWNQVGSCCSLPGSRRALPSEHGR
jgi:hypothetical protein